jgi:ribonuclease D
MSRRIDKLRRWRTAATERIGLEPGIVLPNRLITAIAAAAPRTLDELGRVEGMRRWRVDTLGAEILAALAAA